MHEGSSGIYDRCDSASDVVSSDVDGIPQWLIGGPLPTNVRSVASGPVCVETRLFRFRHSLRVGQGQHGEVQAMDVSCRSTGRVPT